MVENGEVSATQFGSAGSWAVRACELGDIIGCHNAGVGYEYGSEEKLGLNKDLAKAKDFYLRAAERGYMQAQYNLGSMYANKYFNNDVEGLKWMLLAQRSAAGCVSSNSLCAWIVRDPPGHISKLKAGMSAESIALAERLAEEWMVRK